MPNMYISVDWFLRKFLNEKSTGDLHITRMFGAFVAISKGKVIGVDKNTLSYCPLSSILNDELRNIKPDNNEIRKAIAQSIESKIKEFGYFTKRRKVVRNEIAVPYGTSEMMMYALRKEEVDCAVTACDGAGTVISSSPDVVQGIGARMNGLFYTSPIVDVIDEIEKYRAWVVFPETAKIDQEEGIKEAADMGYNHIVVTVNGFSNASLENIRKMERQLCVSVTILAVCTTGITLKRAKELAKYSDLLWSCASRHVRDISCSSILQISSAIPVFVFTRKGLDFLSTYCEMNSDILNLEVTKKYFISRSKKDAQMKMKKFMAYLTEVDSLPIRSVKEPAPMKP